MEEHESDKEPEEHTSDEESEEHTSDEDLDKELEERTSDDELDLEDELIIEAAASASISATLSIIDYSEAYYDKTPYHDSALTGAAWVCELLKSHPKHIHAELEVQKHVFHTLIIAL